MLKKTKKFSFTLILSLMLMVFSLTAVPCFCAYADEETTFAAEDIVDIEEAENEEAKDEKESEEASDSAPIETIGATPAESENAETAKDEKGKKDSEKDKDEPDSEFGFRKDSWRNTLPSLVIGMVGIFLVIGIIIIATYLLNKAFSKKKNKDE